jgi:hypothetical protein
MDACPHGTLDGRGPHQGRDDVARFQGRPSHLHPQVSPEQHRDEQLELRRGDYRVGHKPNRYDCTIKEDENSLYARNVILMPSVNDKASDPAIGVPINITEKHPYVAACLAENFCPARYPYVLIIGAGSGADAIGVNHAGFDAVCIEKSERQFPLLRDRIVRLTNTAKDDTQMFNDELECIQAIKEMGYNLCDQVDALKAVCKAATAAKKARKALRKKQSKK